MSGLPYETLQSCQVNELMRYLLLGMMLLCTFAASAVMDPQLLKQTIGQRLGVQVFLVDETPRIRDVLISGGDPLLMTT